MVKLRTQPVPREKNAQDELLKLSPGVTGYDSRFN